MQCLKNVGNAITTKNHVVSKVNIKNESIEGHQHGPEIRTIVIGEQQKIFLSPRVEVRRVVKQVPSSLIDRHNHHNTGVSQQLIDDMEPRIKIITKPMQRPLNSPPGLHHVRVIKDGRFYDDHHHPGQSQLSDHQFTTTNGNYQQQRAMSPEHHQQQSPRKYVVSRQINVISTSDQNVFRAPPVVSSTTMSAAQQTNNLHQKQVQQQNQSQSPQQLTSMRPPPPPPPIMHRIKTSNSMSEEPSSSIPDLGECFSLI